MDANSLGTLKQVDVRDVWAHEALQFTPWLADNLSALSAVLGLDLELVRREAAVGEFSLDLLARDLSTGRTVIIENQLEATDHDHLGKLLTYAAGHDAAVVIWVAKQIREEHRQALDWLNQHTDENTEFFGVVVEVLQIDDSRPACNLKLIAHPNDFLKANKRAVASVSTRSEAYRAYFQLLIDELREKHHFTSARAGQPQNWYAFSSGECGAVKYETSFALGGRVRVGLYIDSGDIDATKRVFDRLHAAKSDIEREFQEPLTWDRMEDRRASRIIGFVDGSIDDDPAALERIRRWTVEHLLRFKRVFGPRLAAACE